MVLDKERNSQLVFTFSTLCDRNTGLLSSLSARGRQGRTMLALLLATLAPDISQAHTFTESEETSPRSQMEGDPWVVVSNRELMMGEYVSITILLRGNRTQVMAPTTSSVFVGDEGSREVYRLNGRRVDAAELREHDNNTMRQMIEASLKRKRSQERFAGEIFSEPGVSRFLVERETKGGNNRALAVYGPRLENALRRVLTQVVSRRDSERFVVAIEPYYERVEEKPISKALTDSGISPWLFSSNTNGSGVRLWWHQGIDIPDVSGSWFRSESFTEVDRADWGNEFNFADPHAQVCTKALQDATRAAIQLRPNKAIDLLDERMIDQSDIGVSDVIFWNTGVENFCRGPDGTRCQCNNTDCLHRFASTYGVSAARWDNSIYFSRKPFVEPFGNNQADPPGEVGKAYNVLTVGGLNQHTTPATVVEAFGYRDPGSGAQKPDILAPAVAYRFPDGNFVSGTSLAAPVAAAGLANLMSKIVYMRGGSHRVVAAAYGSSRSVGATTEREGGGAIDFRRALTHYRSWSWDGFNPDDLFSSDFDGNKYPDFSFEVYLERGIPFRLALGFLTPGTAPLTNSGKPCLDLDLKLYTTDGYPVAGAFSRLTHSTHEYFDAQVDISGMYTIVVEKYRDSKSCLATLAVHLDW